MRSLVFLIIGLILTILIFSGIFAGIPRKPNQVDQDAETVKFESTDE